MAEPNPSENPTVSPGPAPAAAAAGVAAPAKAAPPAKPAAAKGPTRRFFLWSWFSSWINVGWVTLTATMAAYLLGTLRFLFPNVLSEPPSSFRAGDVNAYEEFVVEDKFKELGAWIIRGRDEQNRPIIYALSTYCTHLGCTPNWLEGDKKFKCPCHGSGFLISGVNFEGPAPRPLERFAIRKTEDNQIIVDKSRKFQKEMGQWSDSDSYILL